jgi:SAM-dependent methyltransferase
LIAEMVCVRALLHSGEAPELFGWRAMTVKLDHRGLSVASPAAASPLANKPRTKRMHSAYSPHGAALLDYFHGNEAATLICTRTACATTSLPRSGSGSWRIPSNWRPWIGAVAGCSISAPAPASIRSSCSAAGWRVTAIDVAPECVDIMRRRGVRHAEVANLYDFACRRFDTIICLCNGLDKIGRLEDLPRFLTRIGDLLAPGGALLADSFDLRVGVAGGDQKRYAAVSDQRSHVAAALPRSG